MEIELWHIGDIDNPFCGEFVGATISPEDIENAIKSGFKLCPECMNIAKELPSRKALPVPEKDEKAGDKGVND